MDDELLQDFLVEAGELIEGLDAQLVELEARPGDTDLLNAVFRAFHTVKGGAGFLGLSPLVEVCHAAEELLNTGRGGHRAIDAAAMDAILGALDELRRMFAEIRGGTPPGEASAQVLSALQALLPRSDDVITEDEFEALLDRLQGQGATAAPASSPARESAPAGEIPTAPAGVAAGVGAEAVESTLRVAASRVDSIMNEVGELVLVRNRLAALRGGIRDEEIQRALAQLNLVTSDLQASVMRLRMQSVGKVFGRFSRVVRDLARQLGKQVELEMQGESTELDKGMVESLVDPLVHLVRNAVDHGIELPAARQAAGKPACGRVVLAARQEGNHIVIEVRDDGAGMDPERIRRKAVERGLLDAPAALQLHDEEVLQLVFTAGFSTREAVSEVSGRGVGMDVVRSQIARINGTVHLSSEPGRGSRVIIRLPLTLAILPTLMVVVDGRRFALPLPSVEEVIEFEPAARTVMDGQPVLCRDSEVLPLLDLHRWLRSPARPPAGQSVVLVAVGERRIGLVVDRLLGQEEVVIKRLGKRLESLPGFAGASITGDGDIALIIDVAGLYANWRRLVAEVDAERAWRLDPATAAAHELVAG